MLVWSQAHVSPHHPHPFWESWWGWPNIKGIWCVDYHLLIIVNSIFCKTKGKMRLVVLVPHKKIHYKKPYRHPLWVMYGVWFHHIGIWHIDYCLQIIVNPIVHKNQREGKRVCRDKFLSTPNFASCSHKITYHTCARKPPSSSTWRVKPVTSSWRNSRNGITFFTDNQWYYSMHPKTKGTEKEL